MCPYFRNRCKQIHKPYFLNYCELVRHFKYESYGVTSLSLIEIKVTTKKSKRLTEGEAYLQYHHPEFSEGQNEFF